MAPYGCWIDGYLLWLSGTRSERNDPTQDPSIGSIDSGAKSPHRASTGYPYAPNPSFKYYSWYLVIFGFKFWTFYIHLRFSWSYIYHRDQWLIQMQLFVRDSTVCIKVPNVTPGFHRLWLYYPVAHVTWKDKVVIWFTQRKASLITRFMGTTWGPSGATRTQMGTMLVPWTLLSGVHQISIWLS